LALEVADLPAFREALTAKGFAVSEPHDLGKCRISVVSDPDGNQVWLHQRKTA
jgi:predicted enzyme related to lactoylglutathione lyase